MEGRRYSGCPPKKKASSTAILAVLSVSGA